MSDQPIDQRFLVIDFETNGFSDPRAKRQDYTLPWQNYPIQLSVDVVEGGEAKHAFDTLIRGAVRLGKWVKENVPVQLEDLEEGIEFEQAVEMLAELIEPGTTLVAHHIFFDLELTLARTARRKEYTSPALDKVLHAPRFCTKNCAYSKAVFGNRASLDALCTHFEVPYEVAKAHSASYDTWVLAQCLLEAQRRGVML